MVKQIQASIYKRETAEEVIKTTLKLSRADITEVSLGGGHISTLRFDSNLLREQTEEQWVNLYVKLAYFLKGWKVHYVNIRNPDPETIKQALKKTKKQIKQLPGLPDCSTPIAPHELHNKTAPEQSSFDGRTSEAGPTFRANRVIEAILALRRRGLKSSGFLQTTTGSITSEGHPGLIAYGNSKGLFHYHLGTRATLELTAKAYKGGLGWTSFSSHSISELDLSEVTTWVAQKALVPRASSPPAPGKHKVILEASGFSQLLGLMIEEFGARAYHEGKSLFSGKFGHQLFDHRFNLRDDVNHPMHMGRPFDGEGGLAVPVPLIESGRFMGVVFDRPMATLLRRTPTGHVPAQPSYDEARPEHLVLMGGDLSLKELISQTDDAFLISRFQDLHWDPKKDGVINGMTRDGLLYIKDGILKESYGDIRFRINLFELLSDIEEFTVPVYTNSYVVPDLMTTTFL